MAEPFVHPTAVVDEGAALGPDARIWHFSHVCSGARIGAGSVLGQNVYVGPQVQIGAGCKIQNNVSVYEGVELEDDVFVGPSAVFTNVRTPRAHVSRKAEFDLTRVGRYVTIGANATVVCGVTLAEGAFVAAGAVVTQDVPPYVLMQGAPARAVGHMCRCGARLPEGEAPRCARCGQGYRAREGGGLELAASGSPSSE
ncbi:MAG: acyltransferase [Planctomycetota bacterium]|nr:acyltransferase [Planctomycetota bacterium]